MSRELVEVKKRKRDWVMPGEEIISLRPGAVVNIGRGLRQSLVTISAVRCGKYDDYKEKHLILGDEKAYVPRNEDIVLGTVVRVGTFQSGYMLDANAGSPVRLDSIAFDGASKRVRPDLKLGAVVYARITQARGEIELEASCCSLTGPKKDWMTGESLFGELKGGFVHPIRPFFARCLLSDTGGMLSSLGKRVPFECCIGVNGRIWLRARTTVETARLARCLTELQRITLPDGHAALQSALEVLDDFFPLPKLSKKRKTDAAADEEAEELE
eukprot:gene21182-32626_t